MTYFDPRIFNKENLKEKDLLELQYYYDTVMNCIENALWDSKLLASRGGIPSISKMANEIVDKFVKELKFDIAMAFNDNIVAIIDNYDEEIEEREVYTQFGDELEADEEDDVEDFS